MRQFVAVVYAVCDLASHGLFSVLQRVAACCNMRQLVAVCDLVSHRLFSFLVCLLSFTCCLLSVALCIRVYFYPLECVFAFLCVRAVMLLCVCVCTCFMRMMKRSTHQRGCKAV